MEQNKIINFKKLNGLKFNAFIVLLLLSLIIFTSSVTADSHLPKGLLKIIEYNEKTSNISINLIIQTNVKPVLYVYRDGFL